MGSEGEGCGLCGDPLGGEHKVGIGEMEVAIFCLSSISPLLPDSFSFLEGLESLLFCGECVSLIREVNRLHDLLIQMTDQLEKNLLQLKRKVDDLVSTRTLRTEEITIKEEVIADRPLR